MKKVEKVKKKNKGGRPPMYSVKLAAKIAADLASMPLEAACNKNGIKSIQTYFNWIYKYPKFVELSTHGRAARGHSYWQNADDALSKIKEMNYNDYASDEEARFEQNKNKLVFENALRLAGKANQGLFGDKPANLTVNTTNNSQTLIVEGQSQLTNKMQDVLDIAKPLKIKEAED